VAIVGLSGSGKSTITKLLTRLYQPEKGIVLVDDIDVSKVELYSLRRQIGVVPQETILFEGTVEENIALTTPEASSEEVIAAAKVACAHDFIMGLPAGYSNQVGERGSGLSGGQRQRVAIARTVLQKPNLLIMDEATSALDSESERQVQDALEHLMAGRTTLVIAHRLSTLKHFDRIVVMKEGQKIEEGQHDELMRLQGEYHKLYLLSQSS
jgi:ATP-binding cassette subfamily B protein